ncbi:hypothetical protein [Mesorhizobium sp. YR577]|uniref:hypothetical protein n=1 Tax=Mesorhizobium sp. YR577 TaxID=1884373 RepID=UPI000B8267AE|nr:hypothetical protein [Mesorhizobium sp. YR577]
MADFDFLDDDPSSGNDRDVPVDAVASVEPTSTSTDNPPIATARNYEGPDEVFIVRRRRDLQAHQVVSLIRYITDFGSGDARGVALDGGWSMRLTRLSDLQLLTSQYPDLIESHSSS